MAVPYTTQAGPLPMATNWTTPYRAARRERNPAKLLELCEQARRGINDRMLALATQGADTLERRELEEALRRLIAHESKTSPPPIKSAVPE